MTAYSSFGTLLAMDDGGGSNFTTLAQVLDIAGPAFSVDTEETTNQSSSGGYEEFIPTIKRSGEMTFDVLYDPADATHGDTGNGLVYVMNNRLKRSFRLTMPVSPSKRWNFQGFVIGFEQDNPVAGLLRASVTVKISGQPTLS